MVGVVVTVAVGVLMVTETADAQKGAAYAGSTCMRAARGSVAHLLVVPWAAPARAERRTARDSVGIILETRRESV